MADSPRHRPPATRYGWGWGLPTVWQGWVVLLAFIGLLMAAALASYLDSAMNRARFDQHAAEADA